MHKKWDNQSLGDHVLNISDGRKAVVFAFQQIFKEIKEDQHAKILSPHRT